MIIAKYNMLSHIFFHCFNILMPGVWKRQQNCLCLAHVHACSIFLKIIQILPCQWTALKKSLKLKELEAAKEQEKAKTVETSAEKLRKILKEERR